MNKKQLLSMAATIAAATVAIDAQATSAQCGTAITNKANSATCTMAAGSYLTTAVTITTSSGVNMAYEDLGSGVGFGICTAHVAGTKKFGLTTNGGTPSIASASSGYANVTASFNNSGCA